MSVQWDFRGKHALVTGGTRGIGREIVKLLSISGASVAFTYRNSHKTAEELVNLCEKHGGRAMPIICDHADENEIGLCVKSVLSLNEGRLDYLVNNVGITEDAPMFRMATQQWRQVLDTNLTSMFVLTRELIRPLAVASGSIVNITSVAGMTGNSGQINYSASKAGIIGFTKSLAKETARLGVRVNAVAPGYIGTEMLEGMSVEKRQRAEHASILQRIGRPEEAASAAVYLLSDAASYITGHVLVVDGGLMIN